jgi:hypothetical protein
MGIDIYKNYVNGVWMECSTKKTFKNIDPARKNVEGDEFQDSAPMHMKHLRCGRTHLHLNVVRLCFELH